MARRLTRSPSIRSTRANRSPATGSFRGASTNRRPHPRQRKLGSPVRVGPLRTTWADWHRGQAGGIGLSDIRSSYAHAGN